MIKNNKLIYVICVSMLLILITSCSVKEISFEEISDIGFTYDKNKQKHLKFRAKVVNPNIFPLTVNKAVLDFSYKGDKMFKGTLKQAVELPSNSSEEKELDFLISEQGEDYMIVISSIATNAFFNQNYIQPIETKGSADATVFGIIKKTKKINMKIDINIKELLNTDS